MKAFASLTLPALTLLAGAGTAAAQQPAPAPASTQASTQATTPAGRPAATAPAARKIPGLSEEGGAAYAKAFGTPDPQLLAIARQQRAVQSSLVNLAMGAAIDVDKLAGLLKQRDALQLQFRTRQNEIIVAMLRTLGDEDRGIYLRYSMTPPTPGTAR